MGLVYRFIIILLYIFVHLQYSNWLDAKVDETMQYYELVDARLQQSHGCTG